MTRGWIVLTVIILSLATGCRDNRKPVQVQPPQVEVSSVRADSVPITMQFIGQTEGNFSAVIQPRISGFLAAKHYRRGMPVQQGQLLYEIDPPEFEADVTAARAALTSAEAQLTQAENDYKRAVPLAAIDAISKSMLDQYSAHYAAAKGAREVALARLNNTRLSLGYTKIYAPIDGIIGEEDPQIGEFVGVGTKYSVLNTISNIDSVQVGLALPVARYLEVVSYIREHEGRVDPSYANRRLLSDIRLTLSDGSLYPWPGRYLYTAQSVGDATGTLTLTVVFPNPERLLKAGEYAKVTANIGPVRQALLVPQQAVSQSQGVDATWVVKPDGTVEYRKVTLAGSYQQFWMVDEGVTEGERVLISGQQKVRQGMKVSIADSLSAN